MSAAYGSNLETGGLLDEVCCRKQAGGVAVLAHPIGYKNMKLMPEFINAGLDGVEAWHPSHDDTAVNLIISKAEKYGLILTEGSDFHGMYEGKPNLLGSRYTSEEWIQRLYERKESKNMITKQISLSRT